jgi:thiamine transport system permease protein
LLGASPLGAFLDIELPAARRGLLAAAIFAAALALGEFTATYFLAVPRFATLTVELYDLQQVRWTAEAWALGALLALGSLVMLGAGASGGNRVEL